MLANSPYPLQLVFDGVQVRPRFRLVVVVALRNGAVALPCRTVLNFVGKETPLSVALKHYSGRQFSAVQYAAFCCGTR